jgi:hypothetical protein
MKETAIKMNKTEDGSKWSNCTVFTAISVDSPKPNKVLNSSFLRWSFFLKNVELLYTSAK